MAQATIWNPNTGEKRVVTIGTPVPSGFQIWTGGTATGQQARQAIFTNPMNVQAPRSIGTLNTGGTSMADLSRGSTPNTMTSNTPDYQSFGLKLMQMLQQQQRLGTKPFVDASLNAQQEQVNRIQALATPGMPPNLQSSVRSGEVSAVQPTVTGANQMGQTFGEQIKGVGNAIESARSFMQEMQATDQKKKDDAFNLVMNSFNSFGSGAFQDLDPQEMTTLEKTAGLPTGFISRGMKTLKEQELQNKTTASPWEFKVIGKDENTRNDTYGWVNSTTQEIKPASATNPNDQAQSAQTAQPQISLDQYQQWLGGTVTQKFDSPAIPGTFIDGRSTHGGYDISGKINEAVSSPVSGTVVEITQGNTGWGNSVVIQDAQGNNWRLAHFNTTAVNKGENVYAGQAVGYLGNTGMVLKGDGTKPTPQELAAGRGTHLHMEVKNSQGQLVDPYGTQQAGGVSDLDRGTLVAQLGKMVYGTRISDAEGARVQKLINGYVQVNPNAGVADVRSSLMKSLLGYTVTKNQNIGDSLLNVVISAAPPDKGLADFDVAGLAMLLNGDKVEQAITKVENYAMNNAKNVDPDGYLGEIAAKTTIKLATDLKNYIAKLPNSPVGVASGTAQDWLGRFKSGEAAAIKAKIVSIAADWRKQYAGVNVTPTEIQFLDAVIPSLYDSPGNFMTKLNALTGQIMTRFNASRDQVGLPNLNEMSLTNKALRIPLYTGEETGQANQSTTGTTSSGMGYTIIP